MKKHKYTQYKTVLIHEIETWIVNIETRFSSILITCQKIQTATSFYFFIEQNLCLAEMTQNEIFRLTVLSRKFTTLKNDFILGSMFSIQNKKIRFCSNIRVRNLYLKFKKVFENLRFFFVLQVCRMSEMTSIALVML